MILNVTACYAEKAVYDPKYPSKYQTQIHEVSTIEIKQTIIKASADRNDEWGCIVKARLLDVIDLVAAEARYMAHVSKICVNLNRANNLWDGHNHLFRQGILVCFLITLKVTMSASFR